MEGLVFKGLFLSFFLIFLVIKFLCFMCHISFSCCLSLYFTYLCNKIQIFYRVKFEYRFLGPVLYLTLYLIIFYKYFINILEIQKFLILFWSVELSQRMLYYTNLNIYVLLAILFNLDETRVNYKPSIIFLKKGYSGLEIILLRVLGKNYNNHRGIPC